MSKKDIQVIPETRYHSVTLKVRENKANAEPSIFTVPLVGWICLTTSYDVEEESFKMLPVIMFCGTVRIATPEDIADWVGCSVDVVSLNHHSESENMKIG